MEGCWSQWRFPAALCISGPTHTCTRSRPQSAQRAQATDGADSAETLETSMKTRGAILFLVSVCLVSTFTASVAFAQATAGQKPFEPQVGQAGKDVVWVPTPQAVVDKMLDLAKVTKDDIVYDLGSGDGRTVITAAK